MSETKETKKELLKLSKEKLRKQLEDGQNALQWAHTKIVELQEQAQRQIGINGYVQHLLEAFDLPEKAETDKPTLEVK